MIRDWKDPEISKNKRGGGKLIERTQTEETKNGSGRTEADTTGGHERRREFELAAGRGGGQDGRGHGR